MLTATLKKYTLRSMKFFKKVGTFFKDFFCSVKEALMPGENADYGSEDKTNHSVMAIVLGSITMVGGAIATPFIPPLGITLLVGGGVVVAGGAGFKIGDKIMKKRNKKKERERNNNAHLHEKFTIIDNITLEEIQQVTNSVLNEDFNKTKVPLRAFEKNNQQFQEPKEKDVFAFRKRA